MKIRDYPYYDVCFTVDDYSGSKDFDNTYLGIDCFLKGTEEVELTAMFQTAPEAVIFTKWWEEEVGRGRSIFIVDVLYFGEYKKFGIQQTSPLSNDVDGEGEVQHISFSANVIFDIDSLDNVPPEALDKTIHVLKNTRDNFIKLSAVDFDNDPIDYKVQVCTAKGVLGGEEPTLLYTPDEDFVGKDCFSYVASDYWIESTPAVITIIVDEDHIPSHIVKYNLTDKIRVTGNFFYTTSYTGDISVDKWRRGLGGFIDTTDPLNPTEKLPLFIASDDHVMDDRDSVLTAINIIKWGNRTDYNYYLKDQTSVLHFSEASDAGECKGELFESMFENTRITDLPIFELKYGITFNRMFAKSYIKMVGMLNTISGRRFSEMFKDSKIEKILSVETKNGNFFEGFADNTPLLECIGEINTTNGFRMDRMFEGAGATLESPTASDRALIVQPGGLHFQNIAACGVRIGLITKIGGSETCKVDIDDNHCTSSGTYNVSPTHEHGTIHGYKWYCTGGTIASGGDTDTVVIEVSANHDKKIYLRCEVTDDVHTDSTGDVSFMHRRTYTMLYLELPKSYEQIVLKDFIDAHNPDSRTKVTVINNVVNCSVRTGHLGSLEVTFLNKGHLEGFPKARVSQNYTKNSGFIAESAITMVNEGYISGAGGYGGIGGKGRPNLRPATSGTPGTSGGSSNHQEEIYSGTGNQNSWQAYCSGGCSIRIFIDGKKTGKDGTCSSTGPFGSPSSAKPGQLYRGKLKYCNGTTYIYSIIRKWSTHTAGTPGTTAKDNNIYGGRGGLGGRGQGYNQNLKQGDQGRYGRPGSRRGGSGGAGGYWGEDGLNGNPVGSGYYDGKSGYPGAPAVIGESKITWTLVGKVEGARI